jgi:hypothetical protein
MDVVIEAENEVCRLTTRAQTQWKRGLYLDARHTIVEAQEKARELSNALDELLDAARYG